MRGTKGGFWDWLFFRIRQRKLKNKIKNEKQLETKGKKRKYDEIVKKKAVEHVFYYRNKKKKYKGIGSKDLLKITVRKDRIKQLKIATNNPKINPIKPQIKKIIPKTLLATPIVVLRLPRKNISLKKQESKNNIDIKNDKRKKITKESVLKKETKNIYTKPAIKSKRIKKRKVVESNISVSKKLNENLIKEIKKLIESDKEKVYYLIDKVTQLEKNIDSSISIDELNKIQEQLNVIKKEIEKILKNYETLKYSNNLEKLNNSKISEMLGEMKKLSYSSSDIKNIIEKCRINLDYYNELSNLKVNEQNLEYKTEYKKEVVSNKNLTFKYDNIKLQNLNKIEQRLSDELNKQREILDNFNKLINNIEPEKIIKIQTNYINNFMRRIGGIFTTFLSLPLLKKPKNVPTFAFGLYMLNNSIRSMRGIATKKTSINYIPSNDYAKAIISSRSDLNYIDYMIDDSLFQIKCLKEEYELSFYSYSNSEQFNKQFEKIKSMEAKLLIQSKEIKKVKKQYEQTLDKNNQKILKIKQM